jgi:regulator of CtrA degradation
MTALNLASGRPSELPVSLGPKLANSQRFRDLFRDGMALVDEVAAYLDGHGRLESKALSRPLALAYAAESMRLTTRLMQVASWLLVQKALNEGDLEKAQGMLEKNRVQVTSQGIASLASVFAQLPDELQELTARSMALQGRIIQFDRYVHPPDLDSGKAVTPAVHDQRALLEEAFRPVD